MRWHPRLDNRLRFSHRDTAYPLYGLDGYFNVTNTNRPTSEDVVGTRHDLVGGRQPDDHSEHRGRQSAQSLVRGEL